VCGFPRAAQKNRTPLERKVPFCRRQKSATA
jgi:hypothetical protein